MRIRYLKPDEVKQLYGQALRETEAQLVAAHINSVLVPTGSIDTTKAAAREDRANALKRLEEDLASTLDAMKE